MLQEIENYYDEKYLSQFKHRNIMMKDKIDQLWQMQTLEMVENMPSPP